MCAGTTIVVLVFVVAAIVVVATSGSLMLRAQLHPHASCMVAIKANQKPNKSQNLPIASNNNSTIQLAATTTTTSTTTGTEVNHQMRN